MTDEMMNLRALVERGLDADVLRGMISVAAARPMEPEVGASTGAAHGYRGRETWAGAVEPRIADRNAWSLRSRDQLVP